MHITYEPSPWQRRLHALQHNEALGAGSAGPGKTTGLRWDPVVTQAVVEHARCARDPRMVTTDETSMLWRLIEENPLQWGHSTGHHLYLRRSRTMYEQERDRAVLLFRSVDPGGRFDSGADVFIFSSGYKYEWGHCHARKDYEQFDSREFSSIAFDELTAFLQEQYEQIKIRCRSSDPVMRPLLRVRAASNPANAHEGNTNYVIENPSWVRDYFVEPAPEGCVTLLTDVRMDDGSVQKWTRIFLPALLKDNPDAEFRKRYELDLQKTLPHIRRAKLRGDWYFRADAFFAELWDRDRIVVKRFAVPSHWGLFRSMDWGFKTPGCVHWHAVDPSSGDVYTVAEFTFKGMDAKRVAREIIRREEKWGLAFRGKSLITGPADTQLWEDRGDVSRTKAEEMRRGGVRWEKANKRSRKRNAEHIANRLQDKEQHGSTGPSWYCFPECVKLLRTVPLIGTDKDDQATPQKGGDDHWYDSLSYAIAYASNHKVLPVKRTHDEQRTVDAATVRTEEWVGSSGYGWT